MVSTADIERARVFVRRTVGLPWRAGAQGPDAYDCGGLVRAARRDLFGHDLPVTVVDTENIRSVVRGIAASPLYTDWREMRAPAHGDVVTFARHDQPVHVGIFLAVDRGGVLHAVEGAGVRFDDLNYLPALGWYRIKYYRFGGAV